MMPVPLLDHGYVPSQSTVVLADPEQEHGIAKEADIDIYPDVLSQQTMLGHDQHREDACPREVFEEGLDVATALSRCGSEFR